MPVGLPDLVIRAVAARRADFPLFFAAPRDDGSVTVGGAHVGVTVDVGRGLFVPVVRDAADRSWAELSALLMRFRIAAMRGTFRASDLAGGTITVSLHTSGTVVQAVPIVFPGQTCVVSLCAVRDELRLTGGQVIADPVVDIGLSYDHRVVNGRACVEFLTAVQADLEDP
jgi:2-oxoglutarate dehydrogenase E2 component (dihydrolipoamide succinyltransferase)